MTEENIQAGLKKVIADLSILIHELKEYNGQISTQTLNLIDEINRLSVEV